MSLSPFSVEDRNQVLNRIIAAMTEDLRICGIVLVGSGAAGFIDEYSDLDFCIVINDSYSLREVFDEWGEKLGSLLPVRLHERVDKSTTNLLHIVLLENYLEIDLGFLHFSHVRATKPLWKVVYDSSGEIEDRMQSSWQDLKSDSIDNSILYNSYKEALGEAWYSALHSVISIRREQFWRAAFEVRNIVDISIKLHGLRKGAVTKRWRDLDSCDEYFLELLSQAVGTNPDREVISAALTAAVNLLFEELRAMESVLSLEPSQEATVISELLQSLAHLSN